MRRLVTRYIHQMKKQRRQDGVNEDDLLEIKQDISSLRFRIQTSVSDRHSFFIVVCSTLVRAFVPKNFAIKVNFFFMEHMFWIFVRIASVRRF